MNQDIALWGLGVLATIVGTLMLIILNRVLNQGDDTNKKVTEQGVTLAKMDGAITAHETRLNALHEWRNELQRRELEKANEDLAEERRNRVRREDDRKLHEA